MKCQVCIFLSAYTSTNTLQTFLLSLNCAQKRFLPSTILEVTCRNTAVRISVISTYTERVPQRLRYAAETQDQEIPLLFSEQPHDWLCTSNCAQACWDCCSVIWARDFGLMGVAGGGEGWGYLGMGVVGEGGIHLQR